MAANFIHSVAGLFHGFRFVMRDSKARKLAVVPWGIGAVLYGLGAFIIYWKFDQILEHFLSSGTGFGGKLLWYLSAFGLLVVSALGLAAVSLIGVLLFAGVFQSAIAARVFESAGIPTPSQENSFYYEAFRTAGNELVKLIWIVPILIVAFVLGLIPMLAPVAFVITAWVLGYQFVDLALDLRGQNALSRLRFCISRGLTVFAFGAPIAGIALIPFGFVLIAPFAAAGAAWILIRSENNSAPDRPGSRK